MIAGGKGGAKTNGTGKPFEIKISNELNKLDSNFIIAEQNIKKELKEFFNIDATQVWSKGYNPDHFVYDTVKKIAYIIEDKFQTADGSVSEKPCQVEFKKFVWNKAFAGTDVKVKMIYVLGGEYDNRPAYLKSGKTGQSFWKQDKFNDMVEYFEITNNTICYDNIDLKIFK